MNKPQNNVLILKEFWINPEWRKFVSSMLYESGTEVASSTWEFNGEEYSIQLIVNGSVRVVYENRVYTDPVLFPFKLKDRINERPYDWELADTEDEDPVAFIDENNWFEYLCGDGGEGVVFEEDVSKSEAEKFFEDMLGIAKYAFPDFSEIKYPKYILEGYDKDNSVYVTYARSNDLKELKEWMCEYIPVLNTDLLVRKCSDGHMEPIDDLVITDNETEKKIWDTGDLLTFRLCLDVKFNRPVEDDEFVSVGSCDFDFNGESICFDFEEVSGGRLEDKSVVSFETRNPDYETFPRMALLTKELLKNVTGINEIYYEADEDYEDLEDDDDYLQPVEVVRGAFILIEDDEEGKTGLTEIPITALTNCKCHFYGG